MAMNDLLSDMLTRIRNGQKARLARVSAPASKLLGNVLDVLQREGYIRGYERRDEDGKGYYDIELKYYEGQPSIKEIKRVSKPGRRVYTNIDAIKPVHNGLGIAILSTSQGVLSDYEARQKHVGGEYLCSVF